MTEDKWEKLGNNAQFSLTRSYVSASAVKNRIQQAIDVHCLLESISATAQKKDAGIMDVPKENKSRMTTTAYGKAVLLGVTTVKGGGRLSHRFLSVGRLKDNERLHR